jgi:hypothetical protein
MLETLILGYSKFNFHTIFKEFRLNILANCNIYLIVCSKFRQHPFSENLIFFMWAT